MSAIVTPGPQQNKSKLLDQVRDVTRQVGNTVSLRRELSFHPFSCKNRQCAFLR